MARWIQIDGELVPAEQVEAQRAQDGAPAVHIFHEGMYEHIAEKPIYIKSRKQLQYETRSRGLVSDYAE